MKLTTAGFAVVLLALAGVFTGPANANNTRLAAIPAPALTSPANGTVLPNLGFVVLSWSLPAGATQYQIQLTPAGNDGPGVNLIRDAAATYRVDPPVLGAGPYVMLPGMTYTWRVRVTDATVAVNEGDPNWGAWSEGWTFQTPPPSSAGITSIAPAAGSTVTTLAPRLTWRDTAQGIFYYEVQLTKDAEFRTTPDTAVAAVYQNLVHGGQSSPVNTWAVPAGASLEPGVRYYWRVRPRVQGDGTPIGWSEVFMFETSAAAAGPTPAATFVATATPGAGTPTATPSVGTPTATPGVGTPTSTPAVSNCNWTGTWSSNAGGEFGFQQTGSQASGVFNRTDRSEITTVSGNNIGGTRTSAGGWTTFSLIISADCNSYTGTLTTAATFPAFEFKPVNGARLSTTPPPIPTALPASPTATPVPCNVTGSWDAKDFMGAWTKRLVLNQAGSAVTGTVDGAGSITGTVSNTKLQGAWSSAGESGTFSFTSLGCSLYIGSWDRLAPSPLLGSVVVTKVS